MTFADLSPLANHLWQSTLCVAVAWLLTLALRKNRAAVRYWLWLAASVKFLIPFAWMARLGARFVWRVAPVAGTARIPVFVEQIGQPFQALEPAALAAAAAPVAHLWPAVLLGVWLCGIAMGAVFWIRSVRRMGGILRGAKALDLNLPIPVMAAPGRMEPGVFGIWKPALLLPEGITERLTPGQLEAILAHELRHVHRRDNLTAAIHMLAETIFWFHPAVWWIRTRLVEERERACDEGVLRLGSEPQVYAESILKVCEFYLSAPAALAAGVTGGELKKRIEGIMENRFAPKLNSGKKLLLAASAVVAVAGPVVVGLMNPQRSRAQSQPTTAVLPKFEVASVKPATASSTTFPSPQSPESFSLGRVPLAIVIGNAYHVQRYQIAGPAWLDRDSFDIVAKLPAGASRGQIPEMLQSLLAERFKLALHRETQSQPVYALIVGKGGPKLKEADPAVGRGRGSMGFPASLRTRRLKGPYTMFGLAVMLSMYLDRPVLDFSGLKGTYDVDLAWTPDEHDSALMAELAANNALRSGEDTAVPSASTPGGPTLFDVIQELGLKLDPRKGPVEILVIDQVERVPTAN